LYSRKCRWWGKQREAFALTAISCAHRRHAICAKTGASAELHFAPNWSFTAKFDGEFASGSQTYAGTGTPRYTW
jgi:hypothetical protein